MTFVLFELHTIEHPIRFARFGNQIRWKAVTTWTSQRALCRRRSLYRRWTSLCIIWRMGTRSARRSESVKVYNSLEYKDDRR